MAVVESFDVAKILQKDTFTIPIPIEDGEEGDIRKTKRTIQVTYKYDRATLQAYKDGEQHLVIVRTVMGMEQEKPTTEDAPIPDGCKRELRRRDLSDIEQLLLLVKEVKGVGVLDRPFWEAVAPRHREAIIKGIMEDVFPSLKTSGA